MEDSLSIIFSMIVALVIMFIVPLMDTWELQDNLSYVVTYAAVTDFVDTCRNVGYISIDSYNNLSGILSSTGNSFDISIEHRNQKTITTVEGGKTVFRTVYLNSYTNEILDTIHSVDPTTHNNNVYKLGKYDYLYVSVKNTNLTQASIINKLVASDTSNFKIVCAYGGCVWSTGGETDI